MKLTIHLLNELALEFHLERGAAGRWAVSGVFPTFLERPGQPHVSLFSEPIAPIHFTANGGRRDVFRRKLTSVSHTAMAAGAARVESALYDDFVAALEPIDLAALQADGWTIHAMNPKVVIRWLRRVCRPGAVLSVDYDTIASLAFHVLRTGCVPTALSAISGPTRGVAVRWDGDEPEVRPVYHCPDGVVTRVADGPLVLRFPAGWYWTAPDFGQPVMEQTVAIDKVERAAHKLKSYLARFPRRGAPPERPDELPHSFFFIAGFYASDLLHLALDLAIDVKERMLDAEGAKDAAAVK